jgi:hypothetical protein
VQAEAHNPKIVRANDGTYLLFSIGHSPFLASPSLNGPWHAVNFTHCNNPAPLVSLGVTRSTCTAMVVQTYNIGGLLLVWRGRLIGVQECGRSLTTTRTTCTAVAAICLLILWK